MSLVVPNIFKMFRKGNDRVSQSNSLRFIDFSDIANIFKLQNLSIFDT
jgi:hypothetical protein